MHLKSEDPKAADIHVVILDGRRVTMAVEFDTDEGWVDVLLPKTDPVKEKLIEAGKKTTEEIPTPSLEWETVRRFGKVEVIFHDSPKSSRN